jgi:hypothetical protein
MYSKPEHLLCDQVEAKSSVICKQARKFGLEPEQLDSLFLDAAAIAIIVNPENKEFIIDFINEVENVLTKTPLLTFANFVGFLEDEKEKSELIAQIISRRLDWLKVDELIEPFDYNLIMIHLEHQRSQLNLEKIAVPKAMPSV